MNNRAIGSLLMLVLAPIITGVLVTILINSWQWAAKTATISALIFVLGAIMAGVFIPDRKPDNGE